MPICQLCFVHFKNLSSHINAKHGINKENYCRMFSDQKLVDDDLSTSFADRSRQMHKKLKENDLEKYQATRIATCKKMRDRKGANFRHSTATREKMRESHLGKLRGPHRQETKEKIRQARQGKPVPLSDSSRESKSKKQKQRWAERKADTQEFAQYVAALSKRIKEHIAMNGRSVPDKGKKTSIECRFEDFLIQQNLDYHYQHLLQGKYYDFFLPSLELLVEVDGEYWHRFPPAIRNDLEKHSIANHLGLKILRITEKSWKPELIFETSYDTIRQHNHAILNQRTTQCLNYELSISII